MKTLKLFIIVCASLAWHIQSGAAATVVQSSAKAVNYRYSKSSTMIDFKGTVDLPAAQGTAKVKSRAGATEIKAKFENLPAANRFGPEYLTYVLWAISPEGRPTNLGELIIKRGRSGLKVTVSLQTFAMVVTAEPYFAVSEPSSVVVMENSVRADTAGRIESIDAKYELLQRGHYQVNLVPSELGMTMDAKTPLAVYEARNAVRIARAAGAQTHATKAFNHAEQLLLQTDTKGISKKERSALAREAVQRAENARLIALKRQAVENLAEERQDSQNQIRMAEKGQARAETAQAIAEFAEGEANAGRATAETAQARAELAQGEANAGRKDAEWNSAQAVAERDIAIDRSRLAEVDKARLRARLLQQLNSILQTVDSARGLIVNMSGVLFATDESDLQPAAREKLAKISGILLAHPGLKLEVEGHTDSMGNDASNQALSEKRAQAAREYLVSAGVSSDSIVSRGFGSTQPVASNDTAEGRQGNRRVELVVTGDSIKIAMNTQAPR